MYFENNFYKIVSWCHYFDTMSIPKLSLRKPSTRNPVHKATISQLSIRTPSQFVNLNLPN